MPGTPSIRAEKKATARKERHVVVENVVYLLQAFIIAMVLRTFTYEPFTIPSESMLPNLLIGDYLVVSKLSYGYGKFSAPFPISALEGNRVFANLPERGDVAVFRYPKNTATSYIKRIVGLPGDTVQVKQGILYLNGQAVERRPLPAYQMNTAFGSQAVQQFEEILPSGRRYRIIEVDQNDNQYDDTPEYTVPPGHVFAMGDNRDRSSDSRTDDVRFVPLDNMIGRADRIVFSLDDGTKVWEIWRIPFDLRYNRFFEKIQ